MTKKPKCRLVGTDGNVFALAGRVSEALKKAGLHEQAKEMSSKLMMCDSYNEGPGSALALFSKYVDIC